jgi:hypothetical protein
MPRLNIMINKRFADNINFYRTNLVLIDDHYGAILVQHL